MNTALRARDSLNNMYYFDMFDILGSLESDTSYFMVRGIEMRLICETVERWTGLCDKQGKRIFEGDVVIYTSKQNQVRITSHVVWEAVEARFGLDKGESPLDVWTIYGDMPEYYEIIGNIHHNKDLIEGGDNAKK